MMSKLILNQIRSILIFILILIILLAACILKRPSRSFTGEYESTFEGYHGASDLVIRKSGEYEFSAYSLVVISSSGTWNLKNDTLFLNSIYKEEDPYVVVQAESLLDPDSIYFEISSKDRCNGASYFAAEKPFVNDPIVLEKGEIRVYKFLRDEILFPQIIHPGDSMPVLIEASDMKDYNYFKISIKPFYYFYMINEMFVPYGDSIKWIGPKLGSIFIKVDENAIDN